MRNRFNSLLVISTILLLYGAIRFPTSLNSPLGLFADIAIVIIYGMVIWFWFPILEGRKTPAFYAGIRSGLAVGFIFTGEMILEYILLPDDNSKMGLIEYGLVLLSFFILALWITFQTGQFRNGIFASITSAMIGSMIWLIAVLFIFYLFHGTGRQVQVFLAEGNMEDFARSGMTDLDAFIMQDFWGAGFFHSILLPLLSVIMGSIGGLFGIFFIWIRDRIRNSI